MLRSFCTIMRICSAQLSWYYTFSLEGTYVWFNYFLPLLCQLLPLHRRSHFGVYLSSEELISKFIWLHYKDIRCSTWVPRLNIMWESFMLYQRIIRHKLANLCLPCCEFVDTTLVKLLKIHTRINVLDSPEWRCKAVFHYNTANSWKQCFFD